jgi:hypothetical protein
MDCNPIIPAVEQFAIKVYLSAFSESMSVAVFRYFKLL